jgi:glutathione S-transferase
MRIRAFRVVWMCEELGWPWTNTIYALNPLGKVPILIDDDVQIYESAAILNYLAEKYQNIAGIELVPKSGTKARILYDQFLMVIFSDIEALRLWTHRKFVDLAQYSSNLELMKDLQYIHIPEVAAPAKFTFERSLKVLVEELKQHKYLLGDDFTTLDIHLLINLEWADALDWLSGNQDEAVLRCYYEAVRSRAAYKNCWEIRKPLDLSQKLLNTFAPQDQAPPTDQI